MPHQIDVRCGKTKVLMVKPTTYTRTSQFDIALHTPDICYTDTSVHHVNLSCDDVLRFAIDLRKITSEVEFSTHLIIIPFWKIHDVDIFASYNLNLCFLGYPLRLPSHQPRRLDLHLAPSHPFIYPSTPLHLTPFIHPSSSALPSIA